jgi:O-antigen ligase
MRLALTQPAGGLGSARPRGTSAPQLAITLAISALAGLVVVAAGDWKIVAALVVAAALIGIGFVRPALFLAVFLLARPLMDQASGMTAGTGGASVGGALGALLVAVAVVVGATSRELFAPRATKALVAVLLASAIAALEALVDLGGLVGAEPLAEMVRLTALLSIYILAANLFGTVSGVQKVFVVVAVSGIVPAVWGVAELLSGPQVVADSGVDVARISGPFVGPSALGSYLALSGLVLIFLPRNMIPRWVRFGSLAVLFVALGATYSRMGWAMMLVGLIALGWREHRQVVIGGLLLVTVVALAVPTIRERALPFEDPSDTTTSSDTTGYESYDWRLANWRGLLNQWKERPLVGYGLEATRYVNPRRRVEQKDVPSGGFTAHNMVVKILVEGGIVLLAAYLAFFVSLIGSIRRLARDRWELADRARLVYILWGVVIFAGLTTDDPLGDTALMYALLTLTGALEGARRSMGSGARPA